MDPQDVELMRIGGSRRRIAVGVAGLAILLIVATLKPWAGPSPRQAEPSREAVAAVTSRPGESQSPAPSPPVAGMCESPDSWTVVADDVELGRNVRTWVVAPVQLSMVETMPPAISQTVLVAPGGLRALGFCAPVGTGSAESRWTGTLWRLFTSASGPDLEFVAALTTSDDSLGALTTPMDASTLAMGSYVIEGHNQGSGMEAWFGVMISPSR
jgi:hypothetical protein